MTRRIAFALVALLALGGLWIALQREQPRGWEDVGYTLPIMANPERIEIERDGERIVLTRDDDGWMLREPLEAPADTAAVRELARLFEERTVIDLTRSPEEASRLGLDEASSPARLSLVADDGTTLVLSVGPSVEQPRTQRVLTWVRPEGAPGLYRVGLDVRGAVEQPLEALRDRQIVRLAPTEVERIHLRQGEEVVRLQRTEGRWEFVPDAEDPGGDIDGVHLPDEDRVRSLVTAVASLRATAFADDVSRAEVGLEPPAAEATLFTVGGESVTVLLGRSAAAGIDRAHAGEAEYQTERSDPGEGYFAARADRPQVFRITARDADHLRTRANGLRIEGHESP